MRYSSSVTMALAAVGVGNAMAGPAHAHAHRQAHQKKDVDWAALPWDKMGIDWSSAYKAGQATKTATATATAAAPTATSTSNSAAENAVSTAVDDVKDLWEGLVGCSNSRTKFGGSTAASGSTGDNYYGNYGSPYGSNVIKVSSREGYAFTNEFINTSGETMTINVWNKVGSDLQPLSGSALAPKDTTLTFVLAPGASQIVAFDDNSQVAWAQAVSSFAASGAYATSWGEANFVSTGSGYDVSAIMNPDGNKYNMAISSVETSCISDMTQNYWLTPTQPIGNSDGSCYIAQNTATLTTKMGGKV